jgi:hypothetical protein
MDVVDHLAEILAVLHFGFFRAGSSSSAKQRYPPSDTLGRLGIGLSDGSADDRWPHLISAILPNQYRGDRLVF